MDEKKWTVKWHLVIMIVTILIVSLSTTVSINNLANAEYYLQFIEAIIIGIAIIFTFCVGFSNGYFALDCMTVLVVLSAIILAVMFHMIVFAVTFCIIIVLAIFFAILF